MPIPRPRPGELRDDFMSRCMRDDVMVDEYPSNDQRYAVCSGSWGHRGWNPALHPRDQDGRFASGGFSLAAAAEGERAFAGDPTEAQVHLSKQETGQLGEALILAHLHTTGLKDAAPANAVYNNFPVDAVTDHEVIEFKAGLSSNGKQAQQWRLTIGQPGKQETSWLARASAKAKAAWNLRKEAAIVARKKQVMAALSKATGAPVKGRTMTAIIDPDRQLVDIFSFKGFHQRIGWTSELAKSGFVGTFKFKTQGA